MFEHFYPQADRLFFRGSMKMPKYRRGPQRLISAGKNSAKHSLHQAASACRPVSELLEMRRLLSAQGVVFNDLNASGIQDSGEIGISGRTVFADLNNNGQLDSGEPSTTTDSSGNYQLSTPQTATIRAVLPTGWASTTTPAMADGASTPTLNIGQCQTMTVTGTMYADNNANGKRDSGEPGVPQVTTFEDRNYNGVLDAGEPFGVSNSTGYYSLAILPTQVYAPEISVLPVAGYHTESPGTAFSFYAGSSLSYSSGFANQSYVYGNSVEYTGNNATTTLPGQTVYADLNNDGVLDTGDISAVTDYNGSFQFGGLPTGTITMRIVVPAGYTAVSGKGSYQVTVGTLTAFRCYFELAPLTTGGTISGTVFLDRNANGQYDSADSIQTGSTVYVDLNNDGIFDNSEPSSTAGTNGLFTIPGVAAGSYTIRLLADPTGQYLQTYPQAGGGETLTVSDGQINNGGLFGVRDTTVFVNVSGVVYEDSDNNNTIDAGDTPVSGVKVYIDANSNGVFDTGETYTTTDSSGAYTLKLSQTGTFQVREIPLANQAQVVPAANAAITLTSTLLGDTFNFENFAIAPSTVVGASVSGLVFTDYYGTGTIGSYSPGIPNVTVYADLNSNGILDNNEPSTTSAVNGYFSLSGLTVSSVTLRIVQPAGYISTDSTAGVKTVGVPATQVYFPLFKLMQFTGLAYNDANANGQIDANESPLAGVQVWVDLNRNGVLDSGDLSSTTDATGIYNITGIPPVVGYTYYSAYIRPLSGYTSQITSYGVGYFSGGVTSTRIAQINQSFVQGYVDQTLTTGSSSILPGVTVYADLNNDGVLDAGDPQTQSRDDGSYLLGGLPNGVDTIRVSVPDGFTVAASASASYSISVSTLSRMSETFKLTPTGTTTGAVGGTLFNDTNSNGIYDLNELPLQGRTVYLDNNNNGVLDSGEPTTQTDSTGLYLFTGLPAGSYTVRELLPANASQTYPASNQPQKLSLSVYNGFVSAYAGINFGSYVAFFPATISGAVFLDSNGNGIKDAGESNIFGRTVYLDLNNNGLLDSGEPSVVSNANGFSFSNLSAGTYVVRQVVAAGYLQTLPAGNAGRVVTVLAGQSLSGQDFAQAAGASISGTIFADANHNGLQDNGEAGVANVTVYLDTNSNGIDDPYETSVLTGSTGLFSFNTLPAGTYQVRQMLPQNYSTGAPASGYLSVPLTTGQATTGLADRQPANHCLHRTIDRCDDRHCRQLWKLREHNRQGNGWKLGDLFRWTDGQRELGRARHGRRRRDRNDGEVRESKHVGKPDEWRHLSGEQFCDLHCGGGQSLHDPRRYQSQFDKPDGTNVYQYNAVSLLPLCKPGRKLWGYLRAAILWHRRRQQAGLHAIAFQHVGRRDH